MLSDKRIVIVLPSFTMGGAERQALLLARHLHEEQRAHVEVWGLNHPGRVAETCQAYGIPTRMVRMTWSYDRIVRLKAWLRFTLALRQAAPDILLPYSMRPNVVCGSVWPLTGAQLCIWNQRDEGRSNRVGRGFQKWAVSRVRWFVSNSQHGKDFLVQQLDVAPHKIRVINNGVELDQPEADQSTWRYRLGVDEDCFLACMVANLHGYKDHATLLKAWRPVIERLGEIGRSALLLLAGYCGDTYESLKSLTDELELEQAVRFLGKVDDIAGLLSAVDLGVFSSRFEGCPNGVLEAMAAGLPVAATDIPGIREAIGADGYPFLAPPGDAMALADRILMLALDPEIRQNVGTAHRCHIEQEFSPRRMCEETIALINHALMN